MMLEVKLFIIVLCLLEKLNIFLMNEINIIIIIIIHHYYYNRM